STTRLIRPGKALGSGFSGSAMGRHGVEADPVPAGQLFPKGPLVRGVGWGGGRPPQHPPNHLPPFSMFISLPKERLSKRTAKARICFGLLRPICRWLALTLDRWCRAPSENMKILEGLMRKISVSMASGTDRRLRVAVASSRWEVIVVGVAT